RKSLPSFFVSKLLELTATTSQ
ncbi:hypothetical protein ACA910_020176, partial [Epithemia clementina (nom. ined.)]